MRSVSASVIVWCAVSAAVLAAPPAARAEDAVLKASMVACPSDKTVIGGVNACGKIWALASGEATLAADGTLSLDVHGLVLNDASVGKFNGTPDGVDAVAAAVICSAAAGATVAAQADPVPLSAKGDAMVKVKLAMPKSCVAPVVVLRERYEGKIGGWLAATGM
jgi:hypothetical protein